MVLLCCFSAVSASEIAADDVVAISDDIAVDEVVSEVDSDDESIAASNDEDLESVDDSGNGSLAVQDEQQVNDIEEVDSTLTAEDDNGQTLGVSNSEKLNKNVLELYVNGSSQDDMGDGKSWETAMGGLFALPSAISLDMLSEEEIKNIDEVIIHLTGNFDEIFSFFGGNYQIAEPRNITFIGHDAKLQNITTTVYGAGNENCTYTFINLTLPGKEFGANSNFINCTFTGTFSISEDLTNYEIRHIEEYGYAKTYVMKFNNCVFKDVTTDSALVTLYQYGAVNFNNCTFENITADSLVYRNATTYFDEDSISFKNCNFTNCKFNGVADSAANFDDAIIIEDCNYDGEVAVGTTEINGHFYVNATKLKVVAVDSAVDISSSEKGVVVITLTDGTNPIAGATVKYTVNGGEEQTVTTGEDGKATISGLTGEVTIAVNYEGNESFNAISDTKSFNFTEEPVVPAKVATKITAPKVSAVYNVAKNLVITLTDNDGKALANKKVTVKVGTISKTLTTNAKGQVSLNVATLVPKTYTATVKFAGDDGYLASSVSPKVVVSKAKPKITAKAKTFKVKVKTKKYTVTLKNNKGKVLKKVKLTLKVGKKTYKATTNSKGKATFKITKLTKKGKYTATVKFAGSKYYKALSKKVKITVKK